jgi:glyoxylase I family protein
MSEAMLEHVNVTVKDPARTAELLCNLFGWRIRWQGASIDNGLTYHVGNKTDYLAIYSQPQLQGASPSSYVTAGGLNHIGILVEDLVATEAKVIAAGIETYSHQTYEPGSRFYFRDYDGVEYEVVSY